MAFLERFASELSTAAGADCGLADDQVAALLDLARDVAHGSERRFAPLSAYLVGRYVSARVAQGAGPGEALAEAVAVARRALAGEPGDPGGPGERRGGGGGDR